MEILKTKTDVMRKIEDDIIFEIKSQEPSKIITFSQNYKKLTDDELLTKYKKIYSINVSLEPIKKNAKKYYLQTLIGKNFVFLSKSIYQKIDVPIDYWIQTQLYSWCKQTFRIISNYFKNSDLYILRFARFDFIPTNNNSCFEFLYPDLLNMKISKTETSSFLDWNEYLNSKTLNSYELETISEIIKNCTTS